MYIIRQMINDSIIHQRVVFAGIESKVMKFVNSKISDEYDFMENWEQTEYWLKHNGYTIIKETNKKKAKTIEFALRLWSFQKDSYQCFQETGIVSIENYKEAVKFLNWALREKNFRYQFKEVK